MAAEFQNHQEELSKDDKLSLWLSRNKGSSSNTPGLIRLPEHQKAPLSYGQLRLWFLQQLNPGNPFYHYAEQYSINGKLDQERLIRCFKEIISRHEILRTTFPDSQGEPWQQVHDQLEPEVLVLDLRSLAKEETQAEVKQVSLKEATRPFDLMRGPLIRLGLFQIEDENFHLVLVMHHIIGDQSSMEIIRKEWAQCYQGYKDSPLIDFQYGDFAYYQRRQTVNQTNRKYWAQKLSGVLPKLEFPLSKQKASTDPSYQGAFYQWHIPSQVVENLQASCQENETTMFVLMLSMFKALLFRYTGESDLLVGTPISNRDQVLLENMIGFFNETVVLRDKLSGNMSFKELVKNVQQTLLEAFAHKDLPYETIVRDIKPERMISGNPLFQVMFLYHKANQMPSFGVDTNWNHSLMDLGISKFDLTLHLKEEANQQLSAMFEYSSDVFSSGTIKRMQSHMDLLMSAILKDINLPLSKLPIITQEERTQILTDWNHPCNPSVPFESVVEMLSWSFEKHPQRTALVFQDRSLSYRELDQLAEYYADLLLSGFDTPVNQVGILTGKSPEMIVGIMAALKAGAAYIPMDAKYPIARLQHMISDSKISVVFTQESLESNFSDLPVSMIPIDLSPGQSRVRPSHNRSRQSGSATAYIMYTSGSTGTPKGVPISHFNLISSTLARTSFYPNQPESFLLMSSLSFDSSVAGIYWTLFSGGTLVIPEDRIEQDMIALSDLIERHQVTHTLLLPSLYNLLLLYGNKEKLSTIHTVIVAGETCKSETCINHFKVLPQANLYNEYGPTEATVWSTVHQIKHNDSDGIIPIGRPVPNSRVYILDHNLDLVPSGVVGEIYICGQGISNGYLNLPQLTSEQFIPSPFMEDDQRIMYKTGDLGRYSEDGSIEFLGRADHQIKLRGFRVEPGEINNVLMKYPGLHESVVVLKNSHESADLVESVGSDELVDILESMDPEHAEKILKSVESIDQFNFAR